MFKSNIRRTVNGYALRWLRGLKGKVTILFITHQLPKGLQVDEAVVLGKTNEPISKQPESNKSVDLDT